VTLSAKSWEKKLKVIFSFATVWCGHYCGVSHGRQGAIRSIILLVLRHCRFSHSWNREWCLFFRDHCTLYYWWNAWCCLSFLTVTQKPAPRDVKVETSMTIWRDCHLFADWSLRNLKLFIIHPRANVYLQRFFIWSTKRNCRKVRSYVQHRGCPKKFEYTLNNSKIRIYENRFILLEL